MSIFMRYGNIQGEGRDFAGHDTWLDVDEIHFEGVNRRITSPSNTRRAREFSNVELSVFHLIRRTDKASPYLFLEACCGTGNTLTLHLTKTGSGIGSNVFLEYVLKNARIRSYRVLACSTSRRRPAEHITISFTGMELRYIPHDSDGNALPPLAVGFDPTTNRIV